jgi:hypothetical protein
VISSGGARYLKRKEKGERNRKEKGRKTGKEL